MIQTYTTSLLSSTAFVDPLQKIVADALPIWGEMILRLVVSIAFGALIGCERATKRHAAGLRTFILVTMAGTVSVELDKLLCATSGFPLYLLSAATVISIAILSSNSTLFSSRSQIKGLTTAVALWVCGIVGMTIGAGLYIVSIACIILLPLILSLFPVFETTLKNRSNHFEFHLELKNASYLRDFVTTIRELGLRIDDIESNPAYINSGLSVYSVSVSISGKELKKYKEHSEIIAALATLDYVHHIEEM